MNTTMVRQTSYALGQVDQVNWRRTDMRGYLACAQIIKNMEASITAIVRKRRGFQNLAALTDFAIPEIQSFEFKDNNGQYYAVFAIENALKIFEATTWTLYATVATPYSAVDLELLDYSQDNDDLIFAHPNYPLARLYISTYIPSATFAYQALNIYPLPAYDFGNINYNNFVATFSAGPPGTLTFSALASDPGYNNDWVGGQIIGIGGSASQPAGYGIITAVSAYVPGPGPATGTVTFTFDIILAFGATPGTKGSNYVVRQPVFTAKTGYPRTVAIYQNRLWCGGIKTLPQTVFGSKTNTLVSFDTGIGRDTDAIVYKIGVANSGNIVNINAGKQLEIFTENNECVCPQESSIGLTPSTLSIRQQTAYGSDGNLKPLTYLNDSFYCAKEGKSIIQFHFNGIGQAYSSKNISQLSAQLVNSPIDRALQRSNDDSQDNYIYFLNIDNTITSLQFDTGEKLAALSQIELAQGVQALNLVTVNNSILALVKLTETNEYQLWGLNENNFMDGFFAATIGAEGVINGLDAYNGYTLCIYYHGQDFGEVEVVNGSITVPPVLEVGTSVFLGMIYDVLLRGMYIFAGKNMMDAFKCVTKIYVDYNNSLDFQVNGATVPYQNYEDIQAQLPLQPQSGQYVTGSTRGWQQNDTIDITQHAPFDLQIQSVSYQVAARLI